MKLPTENQIRSMFYAIRRLTPTNPTKAPSQLDFLERRTVALVHRANTPTIANDGYPTSTIGDGPRGNAELTSVEAAANRSFPNDDGTLPRMERDLILEDAENAVGYLQDAVSALGALAARLDHADRISSPLSRAEAGGAGSCIACGKDVSGAANDRLKRGMDSACYSAWDRAGRPDIAEFKRTRRPQQVAG